MSAALCVVALAATLAVPAFADVLATDVVAGRTVEARGLDASECPDITAASALLVSEDGTVYYERDADAPVRIASLTKIMTAIVALENAELDSTVTVDEEAATVGESSAGLAKGDTMSLETALYALLVPSGNDAAIAIAKAVGASLAEEGEDAQEAFVAAMNAKAEEIGCDDTVYTNPHGLDFGAYAGDAHSTARDVGLTVAYAMQNETFRAVVGGGSTSIQVTGADGVQRTVWLMSTDELMETYDGLIGVKTGTTDEAGFCFAGACSREQGEFYSVVLGAPSSDERFSDTAKLFDWAYGGFADISLINSSLSVDYRGEIRPLVAQVAQQDWPDSLVSATVDDPSLSAEVFSPAGSVEQSVEFETLEGEVHAGDVVGKLAFSFDGETIAECDLVAAHDAPEPDFFQRIGVWWDRLIRDIQGQPTVATSVCYNRVTPVLDK